MATNKIFTYAIGTQIGDTSCPNNNILYGPYDSTTIAHNTIKEFYGSEAGIPLGLTIAVKDPLTSTMTEYWYSRGTTLDNLVKKVKGDAEDITYDDDATHTTGSAGKAIYDAASKASSNATKIANIIASIAPGYSTATAYAVGDYVMDDGNLYRCKKAQAAGARLSANWEKVVIADDYCLNNSICIDWNATDSYDADTIVMYKGSFYKSLAENENVVPGTDETKWKMYETLNDYIDSIISRISYVENGATTVGRALKDGTGTNIATQFANIAKQISNLTALKGSNFMGIYPSVDDPNLAQPSDHAGWVLIGTDLSALKLYVWDNAGDTGWMLFDAEKTYNFTDFSTLQSQIEALTSRVGDLETEIIDVDEEGFYVVDESYNIGFKVTASGIAPSAGGSGGGSVTVASDFTKTYSADVAASANGVKGIYEDVEALKASTGTSSANKSYTSIGDSITAYGGYQYNGIIQSRLGLTLTNLAKSNASIDHPTEGLRLVDQVKQVSSDTKYITVMIGVNDGSTTSWGDVYNVMENLQFDEDDDIMTDDFKTSWGTIGRFAWCLMYLQKKCPNAKILVITPTKTNNATFEASTNLPALRLAQQKVALFLGIDCWIPTNETPFDTWEQKYYNDTLHPLGKIHKMLATRIAHIMNLPSFK